MARQQVETLGGVPRLVPVAQGTSGYMGVGGTGIGPATDVRFVESLGDRAKRFFYELEDKRANALLDASRADLADAGELVEELLAHVGDEKGREAALARAQQRGLIPASLSPTFRLALAEAEARQAASRAARGATDRILRGEHLPTPDGNGNLTGGIDPARIYDEELGRFQKSPALLTRIGTAAFNREVAMSRPAILQAAGDQRAQVELEHLRGIVRDEMAAKVRLLHDVAPEELPGMLKGIEEMAGELHRLGVVDARKEVVEAIGRGLTLIGTTDPEQALLILNTAVADLQIGGETLEENPRTAEMLSLQRHKWRRAAIEQGELESLEREKRLTTNLRLAEQLTGAVVRREREAGTPLTEARRIARDEWEQAMLQNYPRSADLQEDPGLFEEVRLHGLQLIDKLTAERGASDPFLLDATRRRMALATSRDEYLAIREDVIASDALSGLDLQKVLTEVDDKLNSSGLNALESSPTFGRAWSTLLAQQAPDGLPTEVAFGIEDELDALRSDFVEQAQGLVNSAGRFDAGKLYALQETFKERLQKVTRERAVALEAATVETTEAVRNNATADEVRRIAAGRLGPAREMALVEEADNRQRALNDLLNEPIVRGQVEEVIDQIRAMSDTVQIPGAPSFDPDSLDRAVLETELRSEYAAMLRSELAGKNVDLITGRDVLSQKGRQWVNERLKLARERFQGGVGQQADRPGQPDPRALFQPPAAGAGEAAEETAAVEAEAAQRQAFNRRDAEQAATALSAKPSSVFRGNRDAQEALLPGVDLSIFRSWTAVINSSPWQKHSGQTYTMARDSLEYEAIRESNSSGVDLGKAYIAAVGPLGIHIDAVLEGKTTIAPGARYVMYLTHGRAMYDVGVLKEAREVKLDPKLIPPFTTPMFRSKAEMKRRWNDLDPLFEAWGFTPADEVLWAQTQEQLLDLVRYKESRRPCCTLPPASKFAGKYGPRPERTTGYSQLIRTYTETLDPMPEGGGGR